MHSARRTLSGLILATLLLAWSCVGSAGLISYCHGDGEAACSHGMVEVWTHSSHGHPDQKDRPCPEQSPCQDEAPAPADGEPAMDHEQCSCPPDHRHEVLILEMALPVARTLMPLIWREFTPWPPPPGPPPHRFAEVIPVLLPEALPVGPIPVHLSQAPLLI
jgi:hypothetical protein